MANTTIELLDEMRKNIQVFSDYALAKQLGVLPQTISNYRHNRTQMSDEVAVLVANILGRAPAPILALLSSERAKTPEVAKIWREAAKALIRSAKAGKGGR